MTGRGAFYVGSDAIERNPGRAREYKVHATVDAVGLLCPAPIIKTAKKMSDLGPGQVLELISDDPGVEVDMPAWCRSTGNELLGIDRRGNEFHVLIRKVG